MKVLYHHRTQGKAVEGIHIREIVKALRGLGHEVFVVSPPGVNPFSAEVLKKNKKSGFSRVWKFVSLYSPQIFFELLEILYNIAAYINIHQVIKKEKIDFIYERYAFFTYAGVSIANRNNIPFILEVNEISGIKRVRGQILLGLIKWLEKRIFSKANGIIVVSGFLKEQIIQLGIAPEKIHVICNAINPAEFTTKISVEELEEIKQEFGIKDKLVIGFLGWFVPWDNLELLISVFKNVNQQIQNCHLLFVGDGEIKGNLIKFAEKEGVAEKVTFTGYIERKRVPKFIAIMDICVLPDANPFSSPVVMFEYMAMEKPVVVPSMSPILEVITNNQDGMIFEQGNKISLEKCLVDLLKDKEKRIRLGKEACKTIHEKHLWEHNAKKVLSIYEDIKS